MSDLRYENSVNDLGDRQVQAFDARSLVFQLVKPQGDDTIWTVNFSGWCTEEEVKAALAKLEELNSPATYGFFPCPCSNSGCCDFVVCYKKGEKNIYYGRLISSTPPQQPRVYEFVLNRFYNMNAESCDAISTLLTMLNTEGYESYKLGGSIEC